MKVRSLEKHLYQRYIKLMKLTQKQTTKVSKKTCNG